MNIQYGGLNLRVVKLHVLDRQPVMSDDGVHYLFTRVILNATALCNSQQVFTRGGNTGISYARAGAPSLGTPNLTEGSDLNINTNPVITDTVIRHWLNVNRRQLRISNDNFELLRSPRDGFYTDAHNGPIVDSYSIQEVFGDARSFIVNFQITTYVNECAEAENTSAAFLANRFSQKHTLDQDYFLLIETTGEARFRTDLVFPGTFTAGVNPDALRPFLFLPIPLGFKRESIVVNGIPDVSGVQYSFIDRQITHQFVAGNAIGATRVEANFRQALASSPDAIGTLLNSIERAYNIRWFAKEVDKPEPTHRPPPSATKFNPKAKIIPKP